MYRVRTLSGKTHSHALVCKHTKCTNIISLHISTLHNVLLVMVSQRSGCEHHFGCAFHKKDCLIFYIHWHNRV